MSKKKTLLETFASNLLATRTLKRLSQEELAEKATLSVSYVSMLERGQRSPSFEIVEKLAKALHVATNDLLT